MGIGLPESKLIKIHNNLGILFSILAAFEREEQRARTAGAEEPFHVDAPPAAATTIVIDNSKDTKSKKRGAKDSGKQSNCRC